MMRMLHRLAATVATLCIATFLSTTIVVELFGTAESIANLKSLIVWPGLFILVPAIALAGMSGFSLAKSRGGSIVRRKKRRMPIIGANGVLILIPCAIYLDHVASSGVFDTSFYVIQGVELIAGAVNLVLMGLNIRDGMKINGRFRPPASANS